ncbi:hypothetical protein D9615_009733 [Tricholomella constricta]|uniref:DUF7918 domain-containing protein n=1 Tax=Tricholomella constricta TaxID=117010 RepID=A0A8H5GT54_9AGAR|nr:hypothetical protein D9615_009733 [Tricholomella constricta]
MRMQLNNFAAWVCIDKVEQPQHAIEIQADGQVATCWMASEVGKNFSVHWQDLRRSYSSIGSVYLDGLSSNSGKLLHGSNLARGDASISQNGYRTSSTSKRPFVFAKLELTDDDQYLHNATSPELGEIKLVIERCEVAGKARNRGLRPFVEPEKIHERSKKAFGHRCKLGPETRSVSMYHTRTKSRRKVATFVFKYRPLAHLQANGIVPIDKERKRAAPIGDVMDLTLEDCDDDGEFEAAQRIAALKEELVTLERQRNERRKRVKLEPKAEVKEEPGMTQRGAPQLVEVIDLT